MTPKSRYLVALFAVVTAVGLSACGPNGKDEGQRTAIVTDGGLVIADSQFTEFAPVRMAEGLRPIADVAYDPSGSLWVTRKASEQSCDLFRADESTQPAWRWTDLQDAVDRSHGLCQIETGDQPGTLWIEASNLTDGSEGSWRLNTSSGAVKYIALGGLPSLASDQRTAIPIQIGHLLDQGGRAPATAETFQASDPAAAKPIPGIPGSPTTPLAFAPDGRSVAVSYATPEGASGIAVGPINGKKEVVGRISEGQYLSLLWTDPDSLSSFGTLEHLRS
jgi:hypothetical protein